MRQKTEDRGEVVKHLFPMEVAAFCTNKAAGLITAGCKPDLEQASCFCGTESRLNSARIMRKSLNHNLLSVQQSPDHTHTC